LDKRNPFYWDLSATTLEIISTIFLARVNEKDGVFLLGMILAFFRLLNNYENKPYSD